MSVKRVLVIAGSDSSGGAGLEADQRVLAAHGCYALTATTGLTAQNTLGVQDIFVVPAEFVKKQINAGLEDIGADAVMISTSGSKLLPEEAVEKLRTKLLPLTTVLTPNIPEAKLLLKDAGLDVSEPEGLSDVLQLVKQVKALGPKAVLLKGGHLPLTKDHKTARNQEEATTVIDVLYDGEDVTLFETEFLLSKNTHGTGCSLASSIAANLALGKDLKRAVHSAVRFVEAGIKTSFDIGKGSGPINHFHSVYTLPFAPYVAILFLGSMKKYVLDRSDIRPVWQKFTEHDFVLGMGSGTLPVEKFKEYLVQDYLYLVQFARSNALAAYKAKNMESIAAVSESVTVASLAQGIRLYILDVGQSEDWLALQMALAPCLIGYGAIAQRLYTDKDTLRQGNRYWKWIENYVAEDYSEAVRLGSELLERHMREVSPSRMEELIKIFIRATELEIRFWDMGLGAR
ncbi:hypothetical protein APSETT444_009479 [Aspergillus pseudonomiae]